MQNTAPSTRYRRHKIASYWDSRQYCVYRKNSTNPFARGAACGAYVWNVSKPTSQNIDTTPALDFINLSFPLRPSRHSLRCILSFSRGPCSLPHLRGRRVSLLSWHGGSGEF
ncbi:hypothetical protein CBM2588_A40070 [Cupriavidus taiwanensis]|nr:hypothetical protein CBM2588_A40070 [Cupriavidus taiwanensis]